MVDNNFDGVLRGPSMIGKIRTDISANSSPIPIRDRVTQILQAEHYTLSPKQQKILEQSSTAFDEHRRSCDEAKKMDEGELKQMLAKSFNCDVTDIDTVNFHEASVTVGLGHSAYQKEWEKTCEIEGVEVSEVMTSAGLTSERLNIQIGGTTLPLSIEDMTLKKNGEIADHENLHTQYRYLHPREKVENQQTAQEYRASLTEKSKELYKKGDKKGFTNLIRRVAESQLSTYLNELSSAALEKETHILSQAFGENNHLYNVLYKKEISAIRESLPSDLKERLEWEKIIFEEMKKVKSKATIIDEEYKKLVITGISGSELATIVEFLTPDQGFLIKAFSEKPTLSKLKQWKKDFTQPVDTEKKDKISYYSDFLMEVANISDKEFDAIDGYIKKIIQDKQSSVLNSFLDRALKRDRKPEIKENWLDDIEVQVQLMKELYLSRIARLQPLLESEFLDNPDLVESKNEIIRETLKRAADFNFHFLNSASDALLFQTDADKTYMDDRKSLFARSFSLDDASEDIVEALAHNKSPDYNALFSKDFKKSHGKRKRLRRRFNSMSLLSDTPGESPLDDEVVALYNRLWNKDPSENITSIANEKQLQRLSSSLIRTLLWAKEGKLNIQNSNIATIGMFVLGLYKSYALPTAYRYLVEDGTLGLNLSLINATVK